MFSFKYSNAFKANKETCGLQFTYKITFPDGWKRYNGRNCAIFEERYSRYTSDDDITNVSNFWFMSYCTPIAYIAIQESSFYGTSVTVNINYEMYRVSRTTIGQLSSFLVTLRKEFNLPSGLSYGTIKQCDLERMMRNNEVFTLFNLYDDSNYGDCNGIVSFWNNDNMDTLFYNVPRPTVEMI